MSINSFFKLQFNYCPLVWMCHSCTINNKINRLHGRFLCAIYNKIQSFKELLEGDESVPTTEMFKVYSNIACRYLWRFLINKIQTTKYTTVCTFQFHLLEVCIMELKAYCFLGPKILDIVPTELKEVKTLSTSKSGIKN